VVGNPGRVVRQAGERVGIDLDQIHLPDPIKERIEEMTAAPDAAGEVHGAQAQGMAAINARSSNCPIAF
jgi:hypothetical protein